MIQIAYRQKAFIFLFRSTGTMRCMQEKHLMDLTG